MSSTSSSSTASAPPAERPKARKDLLQVASLAEYFHENGQERAFNNAWRDALARGAGWRQRALHGKTALLKLEPYLDNQLLWREK